MFKTYNENLIDVEDYLNQVLADKIEDIIKDYLKCDEVNYFYWTCEDRPGKCGERGKGHKLKWFGKGLIPFIRKVIHRIPMPFELNATSYKNKGKINNPGYDGNILWIGDVALDTIYVENARFNRMLNGLFIRIQNNQKIKDIKNG